MRLILLLISYCVLASCATNKTPQKPDNLSAQFDTDIRDSGLKVFSLSAHQALQYQGDTNLKQLETWMDYQLEQHLAKTGYCQTGHAEIERSIGAGFAVIRGECNELQQ